MARTSRYSVYLVSGAKRHRSDGPLMVAARLAARVFHPSLTIVLSASYELLKAKHGRISSVNLVRATMDRESRTRRRRGWSWMDTSTSSRANAERGEQWRGKNDQLFGLAYEPFWLQKYTYASTAWRVETSQDRLDQLEQIECVTDSEAPIGCHIKCVATSGSLKINCN